MPSTFYSPRFVTETDENPPWTDCTWASGLMLANKASGGKYPATRAEREALRKASGDHFGGSNLVDLHDGIERRYHWQLVVDWPSWDQLIARLERGDGAVVQGLYARLPPHFKRWDPAFGRKPDSGHAAYVQGHDRGQNFHRNAAGNLYDVFWNDPLGRSPKGTPPDERYRGEWMPVNVLRSFLLGLGTINELKAATVRQRSV